MNLLICDSKRITSFNLPSKIEDYFIINYQYSDNTTTITETITLEAKDGLWNILTDDTLRAKEGNIFLQNLPLKESNLYKVFFSDINQDIFFYVTSDNNKYLDYSIIDVTNIIIGSDDNATISFQGNSLLPQQVIITKSENHYLIKNNNINSLYVYLNGTILNESILNTGDVIFLNGLKIIWMGNFIKIIQIGDKIIPVRLPVFKTSNIQNTYTAPTEIEKNIKLFKENDIFFHTPRIKSDIKEYQITIESPPSSYNEQRAPMILTLGSSIVFGLISCMMGVSAVQELITGSGNKISAIVELIICILMIISSMFLPMLTDIWEKNKQKKLEDLRQKKYKEYIEKNLNLLQEYITNQERILKENNLDYTTIIKNIESKSRQIWNRNIFDNDFLSLTFGKGDIPAKITINLPNNGFSMEDDNLKDLIYEKFNQKPMLRNVPVNMSVINNKVLPVLLDTKYKLDFIHSIMLQLIYYHSGKDLKIVIFTNKSNEYRWSYCRSLPHCWNSKFNKRFFASNEEEMQNLSLYLESVYEKRINESSGNDSGQNTSQDEMYLNFPEYYLIITDDFKSAKDSSIINKIINEEKNIGFSLLIFENSINNLPSKFNNFIDITDDVCGVFGRSVDPENQIKFKANYEQNLNMDFYTKIMANIPIYTKDTDESIPSSLTFLEMYNVGRVDQLNVLSRWKLNDPTISLKAPIGEKEKGKIVDLDLHEKFHGPHGLIAGSTGSGKSEFIITYILSMAINYHPYEVQFILIDYKGGGLALAFENRETGIKIPHLVGTITNLDNSEMNRTLVSLKSELQRRQVIFNETRNKLGESTVDIYKYQRFYREGKVSEPMSHLFVISDEFAELKSQQPDFMEELISTARIGRSLGVHLILATQKPSGVVNDQIWSNTRFRVCLRVQSSEDSVEMLKQPDASTIKESGRFYLQVGSNEIFELAQSGWAGALYNPTSKIVKPVDDNINFVNNCGEIIKTVNDSQKKAETTANGEQLTNIVNYLYELANREKIKFSSLWLPSLSEITYMADLAKKYNFKANSKQFSVLVGEFDQPTNQQQGLYEISLNQSNTIIFGLPGCGKENLLTTIIFSTCINYKPTDIEFYILDFGAQVLKYFSYMPHVGDVIFSDEKRKVNSVLSKAEREIKKRKELFSDYGGTFSSYINTSGKTVPLLVIVVNSYESFCENTDLDDNDFLAHLLREGSKYGIIFILTAVATNSVRNSMLDCFENKILLQIQDDFDYEYILKSPHGLVPKKAFGRGLAYIPLVDDVCEFQTCLINKKEEISSYIKSVGEYLTNYYKYKVSKIKFLPKKVTQKDMLKYLNSLERIPIGYTIEDVNLYGYNILKQKYHFILGNNLIDNVTFYGGIIDLIDTISNINFVVLDFSNTIDFSGNALFYQSNFGEAFDDILAPSTLTSIYFVIGLGKINEVLKEFELEKFNTIMSNLQQLQSKYFIFVDDFSDFKNITSTIWYNDLIFNFGIWVGKGIDTQDVFELKNLEEDDMNIEISDIAYIIEKGEYQVIKTIGDGIIQEENEEIGLGDFLNG